MYRDLYRPASNPGRFTLTARAFFANVGSGDGRVNGRLGGAGFDIGQAWNFIGYAVTFSAFGGQVQLDSKTGAYATGLIGGGPTLSMGRLALAQRGYIDARLGYDFYYAPVRNAPAERGNYAPHGPRLRLDLGLLFRPSMTMRAFHGLGVTLGYQGLITSFGGWNLPYSHVLTLGFSYFLG